MVLRLVMMVAGSAAVIGQLGNGELLVEAVCTDEQLVEPNAQRGADKRNSQRNPEVVVVGAENVLS